MGILLSKDNQTPPPAPVVQQQQKPPVPRSGSLLGEECKDVTEDFKILREIGSGKFAITKLCKEKKTGKKFACKTIPKRKLVTDGEKEDLKREVTIMKFLKGTQIVVELIETYEDTQNVHLVMEYCEGGELYHQMVSKGRYNEKVAAQILGTIMKVVTLLHGMGIMHRDLKPENFLLPKKSAFPCLADYSTLKAIDFGLSAYTDKATQEKVGTAFYVAPEVLRRQPYGEKVDIWSAGVILYMLLTGAPPFYGDNDKQIFDRILKYELDVDSYPWPKISKNAKTLVQKMLSSDPKKRPTATDVLDDQWFKDNGVEITIDAKLSEKMKHFRAMYKFKKLALKIMREIMPKEELEHLKAMFDNFDTDEKLVISREELKKSLAKLESKFNPEEIDSIVEAADADRNQYINYDEFITAMMHFKAEHLRKVFERLAKDDRKSISKDELRSALEEYDIGDAATIEEIIDVVDVNKDGQISCEEFYEMIKK